MNKIQEAIDNLEQVLLDHCNRNVVDVNVFFSHTGREVTINERKSKQLKVSGISMRNLTGEFIK